MKRVRKSIWMLGIVSFLMLLITPFMMAQLITIESVACLETPLQVFAHTYCMWMIRKHWWIMCLAFGVVCTLTALLLRRKGT